jgi:GWxTD domain-containing protein
VDRITCIRRIKSILSLCVALLISIQIYALQIDVRTYQFFGEQPYTELYLRVDGQSVTWKDNQAIVEVLMYISDKDSHIVHYDKFELALTTPDRSRDLLQLKRISLKPGSYTVKIEAKDLFKAANVIEMEQRFHVSEQSAKYEISDIVPIAEIRKDSSTSLLVKNGFYMEPLAYHYVDTSRHQINLYLECYQQSESNQDVYLQYAVIEGDPKSPAHTILLTRVKKLQGAGTEPLVVPVPVQVIRSGQYYLYAAIIDKMKNVLATQTSDIIISNPKADIAYLDNYNETPENAFVTSIKADDIDYVLKAHIPITDQNQMGTLKELIKSNKIRSQRQFIFQLWKSRSPINPEKAFNMYMEVARAVDKMFYSTVGFGFQTDRGYIFLKYGKPTNVLSVDNEMDAPPYEIWYYNNLAQTAQTNVRFLFYNPSLVHNDFHLLHSTCIGERQNTAWEVELYKSVPMEKEGNSTDAKTVGTNWNRNARKYFNEF